MAKQSGYLSEDTVCAISTGGGGAISMIRVTGPLAFSSLEHLTRSSASSQTEPRKLVHSRLYLQNGQPFDSALFVRFVRPQSYTGEDLVEYHTHGGSFIARQLIETLIQFGLRQALPGEFSFRAVRNGKMTLFQAQAVVDLISASNEHAATLALEKVSGLQNSFLETLSTSLRNLAALGEVGIDFSDQDIDEVSLPRLKQQLTPPLSTLKALQESYRRGFRLQEGIRVAFVGLPNAGKSSFFNAILGEDRSLVSEVAGTTRDMVSEKLTLRGKKDTLTLRLEDTAGLRTTDHPVEKMGIERSYLSANQADLILFIVDPMTPFEAIREQWRPLQGFSDKTIGILTKKDKTKQVDFAQFQQCAPELSISTWANTSALTGEGIPEAIDTLIRFCETWTYRDPGEVILTRLDHLQAVTQALKDLHRAQQTPALELFASDLRQALYALGPLIGETLPDDILGKVFSDFCIGK